jgi:hypothetical protein
MQSRLWPEWASAKRVRLSIGYRLPATSYPLPALYPAPCTLYPKSMLSDLEFAYAPVRDKVRGLREYL